MNDLQLIKEEIYSTGLVVPLLESMGCEINHSTSSGERVEAKRPDGDNPRAVQVYLNERLTSRVRSKSHIPINDIYDLVSYIRFGKEDAGGLRLCLPRSKRYIINTLNLTGFKGNNNTLRDDPNAWLKKIQRRRGKRVDLSEIEPNPVLSESIMDGFIMLPHIKWIEDNISYEAQVEFEVGYDILTERIIYPIRDRSGDIVGVRGRATRTRDIEDFKYMPIYNFSKSKELFNLHRALPHIQKKNEVTIVEGEKSTMKLWGMGYRNVVSTMGSDISRIQAEIIKRISPNIKVVLALDKDKSVKEVKSISHVFGDYDNIYGIVDVKDYLDTHDSPCDKGLEVWNKLHSNHCYPINKR